MPERILAVEDDPAVLEAYAATLEGGGYEVVQAPSGRQAQEILRTSALDVVITDLKMPEIGGLDVLRIAKATDPEIIVILITGFPTVETAVEAMKVGASDYLMKPFAIKQLLTVVEGALEKRRTKEAHAFLRSQLGRSFILSGIVGRSQGMLKVCDDIRRAASVDANILILGESGVGKEVVARAIHENSRRQGRSFVAINCGAIPRDLMEAELFGHERGAFTGAQSSKEGLLEAADGGTLFLDEVCELYFPLQAKLLRALEEGAVRRLGGREPTPISVRFIASTNRDIEEELRNERFRQDLFFRLRVIEIHVPPLRERREDIPLLAAHFLESYGARYGKRIDGMTREAVELLTGYEWPGNVRELKNVIERAVAYLKGPFITPEELPEVVVRSARRQDRHTFRDWKQMTLERLEKEFLEKTLAEHSRNVSHTAKALGIHRSTLQRLMRRWNIAAS
jgi:DNA-binding NtrC family response regulator